MMVWEKINDEEFKDPAIVREVFLLLLERMGLSAEKQEFQDGGTDYRLVENDPHEKAP